MDLKTFLAEAWQEHAERPREVADRLGEALGLIDSEAQIPDVANLASHVLGAHLGAWQEGLAFLERLRALPSFKVDGPSNDALRRYTASLLLAARLDDTRAALSLSDRVRVGAMAAATLAERDTQRATTLFEEALAQMRVAELSSADPANRALAVTGNNLASASSNSVVARRVSRSASVAAAIAPTRI